MGMAVGIADCCGDRCWELDGCADRCCGAACCEGRDWDGGICCRCFHALCMLPLLLLCYCCDCPTIVSRHRADGRDQRRARAALMFASMEERRHAAPCFMQATAAVAQRHEVTRAVAGGRDETALRPSPFADRRCRPSWWWKAKGGVKPTVSTSWTFRARLSRRLQCGLYKMREAVGTESVVPP